MATIQTLSVGMENGVDAINANDQALNTQIEANAAAIPKKAHATLSMSNKAGAGSPATAISGDLLREGEMVFINATYSTNGSGASGTVVVIQVPAGFRPSGAGKNYFLQNDASQFCFININGSISSVATNNSCSITGSWPTADDYPA